MFVLGAISMMKSMRSLILFFDSSYDDYGYAMFSSTNGRGVTNGPLMGDGRRVYKWAWEFDDCGVLGTLPCEFFFKEL